MTQDDTILAPWYLSVQYGYQCIIIFQIQIIIISPFVRFFTYIFIAHSLDTESYDHIMMSEVNLKGSILIYGLILGRHT